MSDQRITAGVFAELASPVGDYNEEAHQGLQERLEFIGSSLRLNHSGDIIIFKDEDGPSYQTGLIVADDRMLHRFHDQLAAAGLVVFAGTEKFFFDHWYDGCDSNHSQATLKSLGYKEYE